MRPNASVAEQWAEVEATMGAALVADVKSILERQVSPTDLHYNKAVRLLLFWLAEESCDERRLAVRARFRSGRQAVAAEAEVQLVCVAFELWYKELPAFADIGPTTAFNYARCVAAVLEELGELPGASYPRYLHRYHKVPRPVTDSPSLGALDWPELEGVHGLARELAALKLVADAAEAEFQHFFSVFEFGQSVLDAKHSPADAHPDWQVVRICLTTVQDAFVRRGPGWRILLASIASDVPASAAFASTWLNAGLDIACVEAVWGEESRLGAAAMARLAMCCLAPSLGSVLAAAAAFAAGTGWNKSSVLALAPEPVVFRIPGSAGVATREFIAAFKQRAGHAVLACLDEGRPVRGLLKDRVMKEWHDAEIALPVGKGHNSNAVLGEREHGRLIEILGQCQRMAAVARELDPRCAAAGKLLSSPVLNKSGRRNGLATPQSLMLGKCRSAILSRPGVNFPSIRKSYLTAHWDKKRSADSTAVVAGQLGPHVLVRNYLNTKEVRAEQDAAVQFLQSVCQTLMLSGRDLAVVDLGLDEQSLQWFQRLAFASGMAAAFGLSPPGSRAASPSPPATLRFNPTPARLRELYVTHWALRRAKPALPPGIWQARWLPLIAAAKAIRAEICGAGGLKAAYFAAAREAYRDVAAGRLVIPPVEGALD